MGVNCQSDGVLWRVRAPRHSCALSGDFGPGSQLPWKVNALDSHEVRGVGFEPYMLGRDSDTGFGSWAHVIC